jgi:hypothetical protein
VSFVGHEVNARTDVLLLALGNEFESEGVATGGDAIGARVISTIECAILGTGLAIRAKACIPGIAGVAVGVTTSGMQPTPVGVEDNGTTALDCAAATGALRPLQLGMIFGLLGTDLLAESSDDERERYKSMFWEHYEDEGQEPVSLGT